MSSVAAFDAYKCATARWELYQWNFNGQQRERPTVEPYISSYLEENCDSHKDDKEKYANCIAKIPCEWSEMIPTESDVTGTLSDRVNRFAKYQNIFYDWYENSRLTLPFPYDKFPEWMDGFLEISCGPRNVRNSCPNSESFQPDRYSFGGCTDLDRVFEETNTLTGWAKEYSDAHCVDLNPRECLKTIRCGRHATLDEVIQDPDYNVADFVHFNSKFWDWFWTFPRQTENPEIDFPKWFVRHLDSICGGRAEWGRCQQLEDDDIQYMNEAAVEAEAGEENMSDRQ